MANKGKSQSVARTFRKALFVVYLGSLLVSLPVTYFLTKNQVYAQADKELKLLVDMIRSVRNVVREDTRPYFLPKGEFMPVVVSSTVMAKTVAHKFTREQPDYYIRIVSDNPLNTQNVPDGLEKDVLQRLRADTKKKHVVEEGTIKGKQFLISAAPAKASKGCMTCHGKPEEAPKAIVEKYGDKTGYGWKVDDIVGASLVGVPLANVNSLVLQRFLVIFGILTVLFTVILVLLNGLVRRTIIRPIVTITQAAYAISHGKVNQPLVSRRRDEIGDLVNSFELMRRSITVATERMAKMQPQGKLASGNEES